MKQRLDRAIVNRGLALSRQKAQGHVMAGEVKVDGTVITKAGHMVDMASKIEIVPARIPFVSRGGLKLDAAIEHFQINVTGKIAIDVGASTGGFTDCLLQRGARTVYAIDVGHGLIDSRLRNDRRVVLVERTNFRYIERDTIAECADIITIDVSFISVLKIVPKALDFLCHGGEILILVKPQFEVGKGEVGKGGIVRDAKQREGVVKRIESDMSGLGLVSGGVFESPVHGRKGNVEFFLHLKRRENG